MKGFEDTSEDELGSSIDQSRKVKRRYTCNDMCIFSQCECSNCFKWIFQIFFSNECEIPLDDHLYPSAILFKMQSRKKKIKIHLPSKFQFSLTPLINMTCRHGSHYENQKTNINKVCLDF